jgi:hypothetical protein
VANIQTLQASICASRLSVQPLLPRRFTLVLKRASLRQYQMMHQEELDIVLLQLELEQNYSFLEDELFLRLWMGTIRH